MAIARDVRHSPPAHATPLTRFVVAAIAVAGWLGPVLLIPRDMPGGRFLQGVGVVIWFATVLAIIGRRTPAAQHTHHSSG